MGEYEDVESNVIAYDMADATAATTEGQGQGVLSQDLQITRQLGLEIERNQLGKPAEMRQTRNACGDQSRKIGRGCYQAVSSPENSAGEGRNARMKGNGNARGGAWVADYQSIDRWQYRRKDLSQWYRNQHWRG